MPRLVRLVAVLFGLTLLAAACGGDDDSDAAPTTTAPTDQTDDAPTDETEGTVEAGPEQDDESTTSVPDAEAEEPPDGSGGDEEGLGDPAVFVADLSGGAEVPGPGHASATGRVEAESDLEGNLCFDMVAEGLDSEVTDAHIHEGPAGVSGDVVLPIGPPTTSEGDIDTWTDVCVPVGDDLIGRLFTDPAGFYANIHTGAFEDGAIRGQLVLATIFDLTLS